MKHFYKLSLLVGVVLFVQMRTYAQWTQFQNLEGTHTVTDIITYKGSLFMASGEILRSTDNGESWQQAFPGEHPYSQFVVHKSNLVVVGDDSTFVSSDGITWTGYDGLNDLAFHVTSDDNDIYAAGIFGLYTSHDDGQSWVRFNNIPSPEYFSSVAVNGSLILTSGFYNNPSRLYRSENGGASWTYSTPTTNNILQLTYVGSSLYMTADREGLYKSTDNGISWDHIIIDTNSGNLSFNDGRLMYISKSQLATSSDLGASWNVILNPTWNKYDIPHTLITDEYVFIGTTYGGLLRKSLDRPGDAWEQVNHGLRLYSVHDFEILGQSWLINTGDFPLSYSEDKGATWSKRAEDNDFQLGTIQFDGNDLWSVTQTNFYHSADKGISWTAVDKIKTGIEINSLVIRDGYLYAGADDGVYISKDKAVTWTKSGELDGYANVLQVGNDICVRTGLASIFKILNENEWLAIPVVNSSGGIHDMEKLGDRLYTMDNVYGLNVSNDQGATWNHLINKFGDIVVRNDELFLITYNEFYKSVDFGLTWSDFRAKLPRGGALLTFTDDEVLFGTGTQGLWRRPLTEIARPFFTMPDLAPDSVFYVNHPVKISVDQKLYNSNGSPIVQSDLGNILSVTDQSGVDLAFTTSGYSDTGFDLLITNATAGQPYIVSIVSLQNVSGLHTPTRTYHLTAAANVAPEVEDFNVSATQNSDITYSASQFESNFSDFEGQALVTIKVVSVPVHGALKVGSSVLTPDSEVLKSDLNKLTYSPNPDFAGKDFWKYKGYDGYNYSTIDAISKIEIIPNASPVAADIHLQLSQNSSITLEPNLVQTTQGAIPLMLKVLSLPAHGTIKKNNAVLAINTELPIDDLGSVAYSPANNYSGTDQWTFSIYDGYAYSPPATITYEVMTVTGIGELLNSGVNIYPNPTKDKVTIDLSNSGTDTGRITLMQSTGQAVTSLTQTSTGSSTTIDLSNLVPGVYFLKISLRNQVVTRKVLKL